MLQENLISIIVPYYNGAQYLGRFLDSLLAQTETNVQVILVNDGSTDGSAALIARYLPRLEERFRQVCCLEKENGGAASAVNLALKYVEGAYLCWADCDDVLYPENIKKKYRFLQTHPEYGLVNCGAQAIDALTGKALRPLCISPEQRKENLFRQLIVGVPAYSGVFMIRTRLLFDRLENREICYHREAGQNYQLLLPVAYDSKCGFLDEVLYDCYQRADSHSHQADYRKSFERTYAREDLLEQVLDFLPEEKKSAQMAQIHRESALHRFEMSFWEGDREGNNQSYRELKPYGCSAKNILRHALINCPALDRAYRKGRKKAI